MIDLHDGTSQPNILPDVYIHCQNINELRKLLQTYASYDIILSCSLSEMLDISKLVGEKQNFNIKTLIALKDCAADWCYNECYRDDLQYHEVENDRERLMRRLYLTAMLYYYKQGLVLKKRGDQGLANLCFLDAKKALEQAVKIKT